MQEDRKTLEVRAQPRGHFGLGMKCRLTRITIFSVVMLIGETITDLATTNPLGDQSPAVKVENGNFAVYFTNGKIEAETGPSPLFRIVYSPTGELLAPRHERHDLSTEKYYDWEGKNDLHIGDETITLPSFIYEQPPPAYERSFQG